MALGGIGDASAILGVAQIGFQLSQTLITVIGDYRDAATNINRLRDEVHLTSICLQQLGDLAKQNLLRSYGILETTNLRDRTNAVIWEIRTKIKKGDNPLHPVEITKEEIDVTCFQSWRWALWTKKQLEGPRQELDRLKDSMTLTFVSHMALLATDDAERRKFASQIPGIKKSIAWAESNGFDDDTLRKRLEAVGITAEQISAVLGERDEPDPNITTLQPIPPVQPPDLLASKAGSLIKAWTLDPLAAVAEMPVSEVWLERYLKVEGDEKVWNIFEKLHPWFKNEIITLFKKMGEGDQTREWTVVLIKPIYKHSWLSRKPQSVQLVMKGLPTSPTSAEIEPRTEAQHYTVSIDYGGNPSQIVETGVQSRLYDQLEPILDSAPLPEVTDQEIIEKQLDLYR